MDRSVRTRVGYSFLISREILTVSLFCLGLLWSSMGLRAGDWRAYRGGKARQSFSSDSFSTDLSLAWTFQPAGRPNPAWPKPAKKSYWQQLESITARVTDDHAFHPIVASAHVYFGSSTDDHLHCLDIETGKVLWRFGTDGPIRYAPVVSGDRIVFGSDDGILYCLDRSSGQEIWQRPLSVRDWRIPGNGRLISSWPIRTGCVIVGDRVYATAGLYPQQGAWAYSIELASGKLDWKVPLDVSPQGYLLASSQQLFVPTGRAQPISLNLADGSFGERLQSLGGSFAVVDGDAFIGGRGNDGSMAMADSESGARLTSFKGSQLAVGPKYSLLFDGQNVLELDRQRFHESTRAIRRWTDRLLALQKEAKATQLSSVRRQALRDERTGAAASLRLAEESLENTRRVLSRRTDCRSLLLTPSVAIIGHVKGLSAIDLNSGATVWESELSEPVVSLAFANGRLVTGTPSGAIHCFGTARSPRVSKAVSGDESETSLPRTTLVSSELKAVISQIPVTKGFVVLIGNRAACLAEPILEQTELRVVVLLPQAEQVDSLRRKSLAQGFYGVRLAAHRVGPGALPLTDDFAALVVHSGSEFSRDELDRIARPHGGVVWNIATGLKSVLPGLEGEGKWTHLYGNPANTASSGDERISEKLALQWFGGLGPRRMVDRHLRGSSPLYNAGILVVPGENVVMGVDAYTGDELWELELPESQRYSMPYDAGYMALTEETLAVAVKDECWLIDSGDGRLERRLAMPDSRDDTVWGYAAFRDELLFGSIQQQLSSRTRASRDAVDSDYRNAQALVASESIFAMDWSRRELAWQHASGLILNPTITVGEQSVFFVECESVGEERADDARINLESLSIRKARLVSLANQGGRMRWKVALPEGLLRSRNILYLTQAGKYLVAVGSFLNETNDSTYEVACFDEANGRLIWQAAHDKGKPGETFHGEQVHHPVIMGDTLVVEPVLYELASGRPIVPQGSDARWLLSRPGHSCGTLSASEQCLFFRAGNPTVLALKEHLEGRVMPAKLSPTRPGCWINIIPAGGLVLIPEASSGCVCDFSLQTSMAFRPW